MSEFLYADASDMRVGDEMFIFDTRHVVTKIKPPSKRHPWTWRVMMHPAEVPDREREIAHAVAAEREAIAAWLTSPASDDVWTDEGDTGVADAIRNGAHNQKQATIGP